MNTNRIAHLFEDPTPEPTISTTSVENPFAKLDLSEEEQDRCGAAKVSVVVRRKDTTTPELTIALVQAVQGAINEALSMAREQEERGEPLAVRVDRAELFADAVKVDVTVLVKHSD